MFEWKGELYRAVRPYMAGHYHRLFREGVMDRLIASGMIVETDLTPYKLADYSMVLHHRRVPVVTYPFEWSAEALRSAALLLVRLNIELAKYGVAIQDAHPWNILFDGPTPRVVDIEVIPVEKLNPGSFIEEFEGTFAYPLEIMDRGYRRIARSLLRDGTRPVSRDELLVFAERTIERGVRRLKSSLPNSLKAPVRRMLSLGFDGVSRNKTAGVDLREWRRSLETLGEQASGLALRTHPSQWVRYYGGFDLDGQKKWDAKQRALVDLLRADDAEIMLDLGSNTGRYSQIAAGFGKKVIAADIDEACIDELYDVAMRHRLDIQPIYMDLLSPSPGHMWHGQYFPSAAERLNADCVLALALVHHLVFGRMLDFKQIVRILGSFTRKRLIVEFIGREDIFVREWGLEGYDWYSLENFLSELRTAFTILETRPSFPESRTLIVCHKAESD